MNLSSTKPPHGSTVQPSVAGFVSTWPLNNRLLPLPSPRQRPIALTRSPSTCCSSASSPSSRISLDHEARQLSLAFGLRIALVPHHRSEEFQRALLIDAMDQLGRVHVCLPDIRLRVRWEHRQSGAPYKDDWSREPQDRQRISSQRALRDT